MAAILKVFSRHCKWLKQRRTFTSEAMDIRKLSSKLRDVVTGDRSSPWSGKKERDVPEQSIKGNRELFANQDQLPARKMADSYQETYIPLGELEEISLREQYLNCFQMVRIGKLLEDLDTLAGWIGYLHIYGDREEMIPPSPYTVVTAVVDKIDLYERNILSDRNIIIKGNVTWVGCSSMEVTMQLNQKCDNLGLKHILDAKFLMVARDAANKRAVAVNPLVATTEEEKMKFERGQESFDRRKKMDIESLSRVEPTAEESKMIHQLILQTAPLKSDAVRMDEARLMSVSVCQPQSRNIHNKIFGGFVMRKACDLMWANACIFSRSCPRLIAVDDISFRKPVEIGSILEFTSQVVYTPPQPTNQFEVKTVAEVITPTTGERVTTTVFYNTFDCRDTVPSVVPKTYTEAMKYLNGKRRYEAIKYKI